MRGVGGSFITSVRDQWENCQIYQEVSGVRKQVRNIGMKVCVCVCVCEDAN